MCNNKCKEHCKNACNKKIDNFDLHEQAMIMSSYLTSYSLARTVIEQRQEIELLKNKLEEKQS